MKGERTNKENEINRIYEQYLLLEPYELYRLKKGYKMPNLGFMFNARTVDPSQSLGSLPVSDQNGWPVAIVASEVKAAKDNDANGYILFTLQIIDGPLFGQQGPWRLNIWNQSAQACEIAHKQLSALCHVTGVYEIQTTEPLHNIPFRALVRLQKKKKPDDPDYTEIYAVKDINGNEPGKAPQTMPTNQQGGFGNQQAPQQPAGAPGAWPQGGQPGGSAQPMQQPQNAPGTPQGAPWGGQPQQQAGGGFPTTGAPQQPQPAPGNVPWNPATTQPPANVPWGAK